MSVPRPIFRFAPSPNGPLHRGHALSALLNGALARRFDGAFLLRIEDIDQARSRAEYGRAIEADLSWLGLDWQKPVRRQSDHMTDYAGAFRAIEAMGLTYLCFCSRRDMGEAIAARGNPDLWPRDPDGAPLYPGTCRQLSAQEVAKRIARGEIPQARLKMDAAVNRIQSLTYRCFNPATGDEAPIIGDAMQWGDIVLIRKDTPTSYHLAVVVDDAIQHVTHIVRGQDLQAATAIHIVLQHLLNLPHPVYWHHPLLLDAQGQKLAKSRQSLSLREEIARGLTREHLMADLSRDPLVARLLDFERIKPKGSRQN